MRYPFPEVLDSSMLASYKSCAQKFYKEYVANWKSKAPSVHLRAGGAFAAGLETTRTAFYVNGMGVADSITEGLIKLREFYGDFECPPSSGKTLDRMLGAFEFYFSHYPLDKTSPPIILPGGKQAIEFSFAEPLPILHPETGNPLVYAGRMDAILKFVGGQFLCDEKTTSSLGATWGRQWDLRSQFTGYVWGCAQAGIKVNGAIVRGVSILKTKYETQQVITYRPDYHVERWYNELLSWVQDMINNWESGMWRYNLDHSCADFGGCQFRDACMAKDETPWLETGFERRYWSPITRKETLL